MKEAAVLMYIKESAYALARAVRRGRREAWKLHIERIRKEKKVCEKKRKVVQEESFERATRGEKTEWLGSARLDSARLALASFLIPDAWPRASARERAQLK